MLLDAAARSLNQLFAPRFRSVFWRSLGLTIALLAGLWFVAEFAVSTLLMPFLGPWPWLTTALGFVFGAGLLVGAGFLIAPVSSVFAGLFLDDVAEEVERGHYGDAAVGEPMPLGASIWIALRFFGLVVLANAIALVLFLALGLGVVVFFVANGYLLGREYFQFAALRHLGEREADALRQRHGTAIFGGGMMIAGFLAVPILNLLTPLFAAALMVHVFQRVRGMEPVAA